VKRDPELGEVTGLVPDQALMCIVWVMAQNPFTRSPGRTEAQQRLPGFPL
jgi:hypothetical protein